ncbi:MAG: hypothetical protein A2452_06575 [Candidatus Firestonebacteria bacterium RIFOXYC2_FULL_39_67]|nr:MAG: hypothetical protein A2452_06575 [Candidatus Firestonebacteria bacterium RIFOXYC2_FULL_39_67]
MKTLLSKFIFWISVLFVLMGISIFVPLTVLLPKKIDAQILKRDLKIAQYLSREVQDLLLTDNRVALELLLKERLKNFDDAEYIFIRAEKKGMVSSTFGRNIPRGLLAFNKLEKTGAAAGKDYSNIKKFTNDSGEIFDIAVPVMSGQLGELHMGVSLNSRKEDIGMFLDVNYYIAIIIVAGLGAGIIVFTLLGVMLSRRIRKLSDFAFALGRGNMNEEIGRFSEDEIGSLAASLNRMRILLKEKIEKIRELSLIEERDRIGMDFHDGLAQELANIIKRIELAERLIRLKPSKALGELKELRIGTINVLSKTRELIHNIKMPVGSKYSFFEELNMLAKKLKKDSKISVSVKVNKRKINMTAEKKNIVLYIIKEALNNIGKHSFAKKADICIGVEKSILRISIVDNGRGFDLNERLWRSKKDKKWGINNMRQRAYILNGTLDISSKAGEGTAVVVGIPV